MDTNAIATELLDALDRNRLMTPITVRDPGFGEEAAYKVSVEILHRRSIRGEKPIGRKIGFTNRTVWREYDLYTPIWAHVYDSTVTFLEGTSGSLAIGHLAQPRVEPEIVLHFKSPPTVRIRFWTRSTICRPRPWRSFRRPNRLGIFGQRRQPLARRARIWNC